MNAGSGASTLSSLIRSATNAATPAERDPDMWGDTGRFVLVPVNTATCKRTHTIVCKLVQECSSKFDSKDMPSTN
jgi:hypothetical protein